MCSGKAKNFPESTFEAFFQTAHGLYDSRGDFWNVMAGMQKFMGIPYRTVYIPYKIPNAKSQVIIKKKNHFCTPI